MKKTYLTSIDLSGYPAEGDPLSVKLRFFKKNDNWKSKWFFEGMVLEPEKKM